MKDTLPCPFCGDSSTLIEEEECHDSYNGDVTVYSVKCLNCGAKGAETGDSDSAKGWWNKRSDQKETEAFEAGWVRCYWKAVESLKFDKKE